MTGRTASDHLREWGYSEEESAELLGIPIEGSEPDEPMSEVSLAPDPEPSPDLTDAYMQSRHGFVGPTQTDGTVEVEDIFALPLTDDDKPIPRYCDECGKPATTHEYVRNSATGKNELWPIDVLAYPGWPIGSPS